ncbi:uncharacterized protein LOC105834125 isoform X1 [Monomorium pharaonis]|uniref:uncharacterized protein LOC118645552 isoform X1 n=1 Tax=Monomorium pharaonis TaxID=307658 RepID=UPI001745D22A|nr:uncharacterized protein LOC118645552 isoform X1 [Monomorium pharaonis]XP_036142750.1 uncharacterized protein LOC118645552 isoform X1 [Monomorium pharaonis]XP_036142751.1 uncharacterized protein LOC118645552 isoform X1 [Monomorium pharaonis]XP_036148668.1 uncharacterized protein LOC118647592 isoform X1 [Monomorium pharaonis]XP_036148670.1 uncharacterized protein LOC118647592 isoform X1 [Monomorium pharaonis]XP_036148671.1 uncharacterized protein LOC118647592 isoform X1 [Monomorium pharaonis]
MPKIKSYNELSRSQQWRRRQETDRIVNNSEKENILHEKERLNDDIFIVENNNYSSDNDFYTSPNVASDVELESNDGYDSQYDEDLDFTIQKDFSLREFLQTWSVENNITHVALTKLLKGLRVNGHTNLPSDARTLLETPTTTAITTINNSSSTFFYHGLQKALKDHLRNNKPLNKSLDNLITINLSIDGLPLSKSSKSQFWPLLGQIVHTDYREKPFVIGVFHGYRKPTRPAEIIGEFIKEYNDVKSEGFQYRGRKYKILLNAVICDAPARAFVKCIKGHTGYYGCDKCEEEGEWRDNRMLFLNESAPLRTDEKFLLRHNEDHHLNNSPFESIGLKMITQFPLDYMHLVCLGVMKKLLNLWIRGVKNIKLRASEINQLSADLKTLVSHIPIEFSRKPRGLDELDRWKATEFRLFLLYTGLITMWSYLPINYLRNFYALHCAISILCNPIDCKNNNAYAHELLVYFVQTFKILYSEKYVTYNVHNLIHLHEDVKNYGCLDMFSAFPFENYFQEMKKMLRKSAQPLQQLHRRLTEKSKSKINMRYELEEYPILKKPKNEELQFGCEQSHREATFKNFTLSSEKEADSYCYINKNVLKIKYIGKKNGETVILGKILKNSSNISSYPCDSRHLGIHVGDEWSDVGIYPVSQISAKAIRLPYKQTYCMIPILHTTD